MAYVNEELIKRFKRKLQRQTQERADEELDDLAYLACYWKKARDQGRTPAAIRTALFHVIEDLVKSRD